MENPWKSHMGKPWESHGKAMKLEDYEHVWI